MKGKPVKARVIDLTINGGYRNLRGDFRSIIEIDHNGCEPYPYGLRLTSVITVRV